MFNIGMGEMVVILALALILIGPDDLPEIARALGKFLNELKRASEEAFGSFQSVQKQSQKFLSETEQSIHKSIAPEIADLQEKLRIANEQLQKSASIEQKNKPDESK